jgi:hypothetical protein
MRVRVPLPAPKIILDKDIKMPRFPKDRRETLSLCYQVLAEDLETLIGFLDISGISTEDKEILEDLTQVLTQARAKSNKLSLKILEEDGNVIIADFKKKED